MRGPADGSPFYALVAEVQADAYGSGPYARKGVESSILSERTRKGSWRVNQSGNWASLLTSAPSAVPFDSASLLKATHLDTGHR